VDAEGVLVAIVNTGTVGVTVSVTVTDLVTSRSSRPRPVHVPAGKTRSHTFYGHLNHQFMLTFCLPDGVTCLQLGPIGHQPGTAAGTRRTQGILIPPPGSRQTGQPKQSAPSQSR
jgi:hypothetical protein